MRIKEFILYRDFKYQQILDDFAEVIEMTGKEDFDKSEGINKMTDVSHRLIGLADRYGFSGNLWHCFLSYLICNNENPYSCACEIKGAVSGSINELALHDFTIFREMFLVDFGKLSEAIGTDIFNIITSYDCGDNTGSEHSKRIRDRICDLAISLSKAESDKAFMDTATEFYGQFGVGKLGLNKAFRIGHRDEVPVIEPISNIARVSLDDLVGYDTAKKKLIDNTEAFLAGKPANNCLLYGDAGTGKSTSIKAIVNQYYEQGLRIIEVYKHQFKDLNDIIAQIKNRNYKFVLYMDDLSFEEFETDYKYLKAVIEGGLEKKPDNVLIYATSNRRHLVRETFRDKLDRDEDLHTNDTVQEKLSLSNRFGVSIYFGRPDKKEFQNIVRELANRSDITMSEEELLLEANKWELSHGGMSGRTAQQFIDYLLGTLKD